nr:prolyl oligopeptidase family serine peptidase [Phycicoccus sp. HDW14]
MPWDTTHLLRADLTPEGASDPVVVAGDNGVSVSQPQFGPDGALWFVSDESGWWLVQRDAGDGPHPVHETDADHAAPQWALGMQDFAVLDADRALVRWWAEGGQGLGILDARTGEVTPSAGAGAFHDHLVAAGDEVAMRRGRADGLPEVVRGPASGPFTVLGRSAAADPDASYVAPPQPWTWRNSDGSEVHGILHEPRHPDVVAPDGERPPLLVMVHGGPTSRTEAAYTTATQFWTTRGFAVLHVNYSGSTGYGRAYRDRLRGRWGWSTSTTASPARARWPRPDERTATASPSAAGAPAGTRCCGR